jgi:hypothetical protein
MDRRSRHHIGVKSAAVLITGPPGAGKSSVLENLSTLLEIDGLAFGALESEQLGWGSPWLYGDPVLRQLSAVLTLQREAGRSLFLVAATTETSTELAEVLAAIGTDEVVTVLLMATPGLVAERLAAREPADWPGKPDLIEHARQLARSMPTLQGTDITIPTDGRQPRDVAVELRAALRARGLSV